MGQSISYSFGRLEDYYLSLLESCKAPPLAIFYIRTLKKGEKSGCPAVVQLLPLLAARRETIFPIPLDKYNICCFAFKELTSFDL